jgi:hypothetical protein
MSDSHTNAVANPNGKPGVYGRCSVDHPHSHPHGYRNPDTYSDVYSRLPGSWTYA